MRGRGNPILKQEKSIPRFFYGKHQANTYRQTHPGGGFSKRDKDFVAGKTIGLSPQQYLSDICPQLDRHRNLDETIPDFRP